MKKLIKESLLRNNNTEFLEAKEVEFYETFENRLDQEDLEDIGSFLRLAMEEAITQCKNNCE